MKIGGIRIRNFRTIADLSIPLDACTALCGPNSSGKTNFLEAIKFAFQRTIAREDILQNLPRHKRDMHGGPKLSIYIDIELVDITASVAKLAASRPGATILYSFRAIRSGTVTRQLDTQALTDAEALLEAIKIIYVPPIRDLAAGGLEPFREVFADALRKARGASSMNAVLRDAKKVLEDRGRRVLDPQTEIAQSLLGALRLDISTAAVSIDELYRSVELTVKDKSGVKPLSELGTGHQSAVIVHLYRQLAEQSAATVILLLEEPDNHLHPVTIRAVAEDILQLAEDYQVVVTTHSPIFLESVGLNNVVPIASNDAGETFARRLNLTTYDSNDIRRMLQQFNLRITEPLLAEKVIVVEGAFDSGIVTPLIEKALDGRAADAGILIIVAGGKDGVVTLCKFAEACGLDWVAVFDLDAAFSPELPRTKASVTAQERADAIAAALALDKVMDSTFKRGRNVKRTLTAVVGELNNGRPFPTPYAGSHIEQLADVASITATHRLELKQHLAGNRISKASSLLREYNIVLWSGELEAVLLRTVQCEAAVETTFIREGVLKGPIVHDRKANLQSLLRGLAYEPEVLAKVINDLDKKKLFKRSDRFQCFAPASFQEYHVELSM